MGTKLKGINCEWVGGFVNLKKYLKLKLKKNGKVGKFPNIGGFPQGLSH